MAFGSFDTKKFIHSVRIRPILWDVALDDYSNKSKRRVAWIKVCKEMFNGFEKYTEEEQTEMYEYVHKKWKNLRNCFSRELRNRKMTKPGTNATDRKPYTFYDDLIFLQGDSQHWTINDASETETPEEMRYEITAEKDSTERTPSPSISTTSIPSLGKRQRRSEHEPDFTASLHSFSDLCTSELVTEESNTNNRKRQLMVFFDDIAETMLKFSSIDQAEIKRDIFNIVNTKELEILRRKESEKMGASEPARKPTIFQITN